MASIEYQGLKFSGGKFFIILSLIGAIIGGGWTGYKFYDEFPLNEKARIVFANDKEKFIFFQALTQSEGILSGKYLINGEDVCNFSFEEFILYK